MASKSFTLSREFLRDRCDYCGLCLNRCPVMALPIDQARREMKNLVEGGPSCVLAECTGCMACNGYCPTDANPHTLILTRWGERCRKEGIPQRASLVLPYQKPNLYTLLIERLPESDRALVNEWRENWLHPKDASTMIYAGCNLLLMPGMADSKIVAGTPIFGAPELCCGEPLYRMGCWDAEQAVARHIQEAFRNMPMKTLIFPCLACLHIFKHVYKDVFNVAFDFEMISMEEWILDRIDRGEIAVTPLNKRAVIHDNCWPKASGDFYFDLVRTLLDRLGITVVEPEHTREDALCCGMCAPAAQFRLRDALYTAKARLREFEEADADMVIDYCGGCDWLFAVARRLLFAKSAKPIYHLLDVVRMAVGEPPRHESPAVAKAIVRTIGPRLAASYMTPGRFHIRRIMDQPVQPL